MNFVCLAGRLTSNAELRYSTNTHTPTTRFTLAVDRVKKDTGADFINCIAFNRVAEIISQYTNKGSRIGIFGNIRTGSYEKDGKRVYTTDVIVNQIELLEDKQTEAQPEVIPTAAQIDEANEVMGYSPDDAAAHEEAQAAYDENDDLPF